MERLKSYRDVKIGDKIICVDEGWDVGENQHLTLGKEYEVVDTEFRFPKAIAITTNAGIEMFVVCECFSKDIKSLRKAKINKINKNV